ncbi:MAG: ABC-2 family transporter protein [Chloroflexi bacterium]|nr:ABC-2 family transporter protein [Chloroflexota bacterium]
MIKRELVFLLALWKANLLAAMEFRAAFLSQVIGMMLNNLVYFVFWVIFFDRFQNVRGWGLSEMILLFGVVATGFGAAVYLFGNALELATVIANGRLDYYLSLPRPVLLHVLASKSISSGLGDFTYGILSFIVAGLFTPDAILRAVLATLLAMIVFLSFMTFVNSLGFWMGNATMIAQQASGAMITFSLYPITLFEGSGKFLLFTIIPAAFVGAVPAEFIRGFDAGTLLQLLAAALILLALALFTFHLGLRRYESGSAIQVQS